MKPLSLLSLIAASAVALGQVQTLLQTGFEANQGFSLGPLAGQNQWLDNTSTAEITADLSRSGDRAALVPMNEVGLSGNLGPSLTFDPLTTANRMLRLEWTQFSRHINRPVGSTSATTVGFEVRAGGHLVAGARVQGGTDIVEVWNGVSQTFEETNGLAPREGWVSFQVHCDPVAGKTTYYVDNEMVAADVPSAPAAGPIDRFAYTLTDTGFEHLYVDDVTFQALPVRSMIVRTNSTVAPNLEEVEHQVKFQRPSDGLVFGILTGTPTANRALTITAPDQTGPMHARVKPRGHLSRVFRNYLAYSTSNLMLTETFIAGDITNDDVIDVADYAELSRDFDLTAIAPTWWTPRANGVRPADSDITRDGLVDIADYDALVYGFDQFGELP